MKHGDKAKKPAQGKASGKKASSKVASPTPAKKGSEASAKTAAPAKTGAGAKPQAGGNGKGGIQFTNPLVGSAFKRAVKKYPAAFRKLTD